MQWGNRKCFCHHRKMVLPLRPRTLSDSPSPQPITTERPPWLIHSVSSACFLWLFWQFDTRLKLHFSENVLSLYLNVQPEYSEVYNIQTWSWTDHCSVWKTLWNLGVNSSVLSCVSLSGLWGGCRLSQLPQGERRGTDRQSVSELTRTVGRIHTWGQQY